MPAQGGTKSMSEKKNVWLERHAGSKHGLVFGVIALAAAAAIFSIDTYTKIEGAIAVLYVIVLLLSAEATTRTGLLVATGLCIGLSILSYLLTHGLDPDLQTALRLTVALAALCVTAALLLRNDRARTNILMTNAALRESERRYRSIFDMTRVALWERDYSRVRAYIVGLKEEGVTDLRDYIRTHPEVIPQCIAMIGVVAANDAAVDLLGRRAGSNSPGVMSHFISPANEAFLDVLQAIFDGASFFEGMAEITAEAGETKLVLLSISFPDDPAAFNRVVVSMVDITQREQARKALVEAQAELTRAARAATVGVMSASLAHELNQPLGAIVVNSQTLLRWLDRDPPDLAAARRSAERMIRDSQRASSIIHNTRSLLSQSQEGIEQVDLSALVRDTLALMEHELEKERTTVEIVQIARVPSISSVKIEMQQVMINLIANAVQAMSAARSENRRITIALDAADNAKVVAITVRDTGPGLSADTLEKLFFPFYTTKESGMGMGLSICRSTIEARGGSLVGSNHPEGGAVFEIRLPVEVANA
ncbi:ATP-binding protein [Rhizobium sp. BK376]|uniref:PAS domain-containing sensor histidine kinase n=1 Tax=Rhizobium sp. BK376 TaxID=2512149 RepID=UPI0032AE90AA